MSRQSKKRHDAPYSRVRGSLVNLHPSAPGQTVTTTKKVNQADSISSVDHIVDYGSQVGEVMTDIVTPGFERLSREGSIIINPMTTVRRAGLDQPFTGRQYLQTRSGYTPSGSTYLVTVDQTNVLPSPHGFEPVQTIAPLSEKVIAQASNEALAAARQRSAESLIDLFEIKQTMGMITKNVQNIADLIQMGRLRSLKMKRVRGTKIKIRDHTGRTVAGRAADASGLWLEYHYGWVPLMLSIKGAIEALSEQVKPLRQTFRGSDSSSDELVTSVLQPFYSSLDPTKLLGQSERKITQNVVVRARAGVITEYQATLLGRLGLELTDLPAAGYDLVKLSFLLDWFWDLNTFIKAITPPKGLDFLGSWVTLTTEEITTWSYEHPAFSDSRSYGSGNYQYTYQATWPARYMSVTQSNEITTRTPGVTAKLPSIDLDFKSLTHAISAAALAISIAHGRVIRRI